MKPIKAWAVAIDGKLEGYPILKRQKDAVSYRRNCFPEDFPRSRVEVIRVEIRAIKPKRKARP